MRGPWRREGVVLRHSLRTAVRTVYALVLLEGGHRLLSEVSGSLPAGFPGSLEAPSLLPLSHRT